MSTLLVASTGGHLAQLHRLLPRFRGVAGDVTWVTFDSPQSRSLLEGEEVVYVPYTAPRDGRRVLENTPRALALLQRRSFGVAISTGSAVALSFLPAARRAGTRCHYIESAARGAGPSVTGRILRWVPGVRLYSQYRKWAVRPWSYGGSVFDDFVARRASVGSVTRVVVTLGTIGYPFHRLVRRLREVLPAGSEVLWQTGATAGVDVPASARRAMPAKELEAAMRDADVVIAHAGVGSALAALSAGKAPVLVPRRRAHGEHVDDHQEQIAAELSGRGLALGRDADELTVEDLLEAAARRVDELEAPSPFALA